MSCIFMSNFRMGPSKLDALYREKLDLLHEELATAVGGEPGCFELHFDNSIFRVAVYGKGLVVAPDVHIWVEWYEKPLRQKKLVAEAIHRFIENVRLSHSDIVFCDRPSETFFVNGKLVYGGATRRKGKGLV